MAWIAGEECSQFGGEEGKGEECARSGGYPSDFEEDEEDEGEAEQKDHEEKRQSKDEQDNPPGHKDNSDEPTYSAATEPAVTASGTSTLQVAGIGNIERIFFNTTEGTANGLRGTLKNRSGSLGIPRKPQEMFADPGGCLFEREESRFGQPMENTAHLPGEASLAADRVPTAEYPHKIADDRVSVERRDSAVSKSPVPGKPQEISWQTRQQRRRDFTNDVLKPEDRSDEYSEFTQESAASVVAADVGAYCVVGSSRSLSPSITGTSGAATSQQHPKGCDELRPKDRTENGHAGAAEDTPSRSNQAPPKEGIQENNWRECLEETDRKERAEKHSAGSARGESDDYAQDTLLREKAVILKEARPLEFPQGDAGENNAQEEKTDERFEENTAV